MTKEEIYDKEISPLMGQIIAICNRHNLPMHASFALDGDLCCTSHVGPTLEEVSEDDRDGYMRFRDKYDAFADRAKAGAGDLLMLTTRDEDGNITAMEAIL